MSILIFCEKGKQWKVEMEEDAEEEGETYRQKIEKEMDTFT